jgi:hypothetical protein
MEEKLSSRTKERFNYRLKRPMLLVEQQILDEEDSPARRSHNGTKLLYSNTHSGESMFIGSPFRARVQTGLHSPSLESSSRRAQCRARWDAHAAGRGLEGRRARMNAVKEAGVMLTSAVFTGSIVPLIMRELGVMKKYEKQGKSDSSQGLAIARQTRVPSESTQCAG